MQVHRCHDHQFWAIVHIEKPSVKITAYHMVAAAPDGRTSKTCGEDKTLQNFTIFTAVAIDNVDRRFAQSVNHTSSVFFVLRGL